MEKLNLSKFKSGVNRYTYYQIPAELIENPIYDDIDFGSKLLYGMLLSMTSLSARNSDFIDNNNDVFIIYTIEKIMKKLRCSKKTAVKMLKQLENIGLIERYKQGKRKPDIIYVYDFATLTHTTDGLHDLQSNRTENTKSTYPPRVANPKIKYNADKETIKNEVINQIELIHLQNKYPMEQTRLQELCNIIVEVLTSRKKTWRIQQTDMPATTVKNVFAQLSRDHVEYVLESLRKTTTEVTSVKSYMQTALYNSVFTIDSNYAFAAQKDLHEKFNV